MTDPRLHIAGLSPAGGSAGQVPTINSAGTAVVFQTPPAAAGGSGGGDTAWTVIGAAGAPAFENGWTSYNAAHSGATFETPAFRKDGSGRVWLKGTVANGPISGNDSLGIFTLPAGYRPVGEAIFPTICGGSNVLGRLDILPSGLVVAAAGANTFFSLDGFSFLTT